MFVKFASAQVLDAKVAQRNGRLMKDAHRHEFQYDPRPGFLYVRSRAISSRTNDNYDNFPAEEIKKAYKTFIGKPVFVNHHNDNHRRARGVIVDAALHEDKTPQGQPDTWVEVLMEVDAVNFPKLAQAIVAGHIDRTSMGTDVAFSVCSVCDNKAETPLDYCKHIPAMKGMKFQRVTASGTKEEVLCYEKCYGLSFFENSLLVEEPADPTAYFLGVDDRGLAMTASKKPFATDGFVMAGRPKTAVEMDPEVYGERWEGRDGELRYDVWINQSQSMRTYRFRLRCDDHGVIADKGSYGSLASAQEAADRVVDGHERTQHNDDDAGIDNYQSRVDEGRNPYTGNRKVASKTARNPFRRKDGSPTFRYMPRFGDSIVEGLEPGAEVALWDDPDHLRATNAQTARVYPLRFIQDLFHPPFEMAETIEVPVSTLVMATKKAKLAAKADCAICGDPAVYGVDIIHPDGSREVKTLCERHENFYEATEDDQTIMWMAAARKNKTAAGWRDFMDEHVEVIDATPQWADRKCNICGAPATNYIMGPYAGDWADYYCDEHSQNPDPGSIVQRLAYGETKVPAQVDTLRDENCPVCGESDSFDGDRCLVCQYVRPPEEFMDPDLEKAKQIDLRQDGEALDGGNLQCDNCGAEYPASAEPTAIKTSAKPNPFKKKDEDEEDEESEDDESEDDENPFAEEGEEEDPEDPENPFAEEGDDAATPEDGDTQTYTAGDVCPTCGEGTLQPQQPEEVVSEDGSENAPEEAGTDGEDGEVENPFAEKGENSDESDEDSEDEDSEQEDSEDDEDDDKKSKFPFKQKKSSTNTGGIMRATLEALAKYEGIIDNQNKRIAALSEGLRFIAQAAGIEKHPRVASLLKVAENPGSPVGWATPSEEAATEAPAVTTEETLGFDNESQEPALPDDPTEPGATSETDVSADAQTSVDSTDTVLEEPLDLNEQDPTKLVEGTDTLDEGGVGEPGSTRTETEVRIGDPNKPDAAFTETGWTEAAKQSRVIAALRLARLRIQANIEKGDDLELSTRIAQSNLSDAAIQGEIDTLSKVVAAAKQQPRRTANRRLVPRSASGVERTVPSLAQTQAPTQKVAHGPAEDEFLFE